MVSRLRTDLLSQYAQVLQALHRNREAHDAAQQAKAANAQVQHVQTATEVVHVGELASRGGNR